MTTGRINQVRACVTGKRRRAASHAALPYDGFLIVPAFALLPDTRRSPRAQRLRTKSERLR